MKNMQFFIPQEFLASTFFFFFPKQKQYFFETEQKEGLSIQEIQYSSARFTGFSVISLIWLNVFFFDTSRDPSSK